jgi:uncharacterized protein
VLTIVCDSNAFVRALINSRSAWGRLLFEHSHQYRLMLSREIIGEVIDVLNRPALLRKFERRGDVDTMRVLDIIGRAEVIDVINIPSVSRDPDDDVFLEVARLSDADFLVSGDNDLLVLGTHSRTRIVTAIELVSILESM